MKKVDPKIAEKVMVEKGYEPLEPYRSAISKWKCKCSLCERIVFVVYNQVKYLTKRKKGCAYCVGNKVDKQTVDKIMLKAGLEPLEPYKNNNAKWKCRCVSCGNIVFPTRHSIQQGQKGCRNCSNMDLSKRFRMSEEKAIQILKDSNLQPLEPYINSHISWRCKCLVCKNEVEVMLSNIKRGQGGCVFCANRKVSSSDAVKIMRKQGYEPLVPFEKAHAKWKSKCKKCGKVSFPIFTEVQAKKNITGCKYCNVRFMDEENAVQVMLDAGLRPLEPYVNARKGWKSECMKCKNIVRPAYDSVRTGKGCAFCSPLGINLKIPSYLYLITHFGLNAHKVGIGNVRPEKRMREDRLLRFQKENWQMIRVWHFENGSEALLVEKAIFKVIRKEMQIPIYLSLAEMPKTEGHTETVDADLISLKELEKIINKVIKGLQVRPMIPKKN